MSGIGRMVRGLAVVTTVIGALSIGAAQAVASERAERADAAPASCNEEECNRYCIETFGPGAISDCVVGVCVCEY